MDVFVQEIRAGITRTEEFEKKGLASFAVNAGLKCGHGCLYCSTPSLVRCHQAFQTIGRSAFEDGFAVVDPGVVERVARDAARKRNRGMIQMGTTTDFYSPEARQHNLGREVLEAILAQPDWSIRILTKSHRVRDDFDLIERHRDRILVGISLTALPASQAIISIIEPHASTIVERQATLVEAHERGIRTFGMLCPLLPGIALQSRRAGQRRVEVQLTGALPRLSHTEKGQDDDGPKDSWHEAAAQAEEIVDRHIDLVNRLYDEMQPQELACTWQGRAEGMAVRPLGEVARAWQESGERDEPRMALIVRLERDNAFRRLLSDVSRRPRRILVRHRQMQAVARVQEVDPACIRWLVRQPGVSLAQKAGIRQETLGVVRIETADTPENRVVRDLVRRAIIACNRYIAENRGFRQHQRVLLIRRFRHELQGFLATTPLAGVRALAGVPAPNYVLQHDTRYRPLWGAYLLLVRQQMQQDEAWRWRHRIWAEHLTLGVMASLQAGDGRTKPVNADILVRPEQVCGRFLDPSGVPASWRLAGNAGAEAIDLVIGDRACDHPLIPASLTALGPDLVLIKRSLFKARPLSILAIWAVLDFDIAIDRLQERTASLSAALRGATAPCALHAAIVQPSLDETRVGAVIEGNATGIRMPLKAGMPTLATAIWKALSILRLG